jgi:hypothetical protein
LPGIKQQDKYEMKTNRLVKILTIVCLSVIAGAIVAKADETVRLEIRLRDVGGTAVAGEPVILERLPEEEPMPCLTDADGACAWQVGRGLYQVLSDRPLDQVSALALAEGGLRGFGVTVGDTDIVYHFTFHNDGHAYFDGAPDAAVPAPLIPSLHALQGGVAPTPVLPVMGTDVTPMRLPTGSPDTAPSTGSEQAVAPPTGQTYRLLFFMALGLAAGGGLHAWSRLKERSHGPSRPGDHTATQRTDQEEPHA